MTRRGPGWLSDREIAAEREVGTPFDLTRCVREPIHRLGGVQSYGALVAARGDRIEVVSANAAGLLGRELLGEPVARLLGDEQWATVQALAAADTGESAILPVEVAGAGRFDVTVHRSDALLVLEFEPARSAPVRPFSSFYAPIRQALVRLQRAASVREACQAAVREVRAITGYDRVVAYRFESADGPGEVVAEDVTADWEPWLGLWFPATDIPPQARRLYEKNWIRVIADVDDPTARLVPAALPDTGEPLDLSLSVLRTVSEFHLEYLRNIEVTSSMSVSLLADGRLWGLIACHGRSANQLSPELRAACEFFGVALSLHLAALRERDEASARERSRDRIARLVETIAVDLPDHWAGNLAALAGVIDCDAVSVRTDAHVAWHGADPGPGALDELWAVLPRPAAGELWHTDRLAEALPALAGHSGRLDGALMLPLGSGGDAIVWLRGERTVERRWATDPLQPVTLGPNGRRLTPRGSTAVYLATVRGRSRQWSTTDLVMAADLGRAMTEVALARARTLAMLNSELSRSNTDLDSFAHAAAHDLKEPLRGIANTAAFIQEDAGPAVDEVTSRRLDSIQRLATRMDELLNSLLYYSRLGRTGLDLETVDLQAAADRALEVAGPRLAENRVEVTLTASAGFCVYADPVRLDEVLVNLLVNAAKYARADGPRRVEVGGRRITPPGATAAQPAVFVTDNGIGIPEHLREQVFELFRRLHPHGEHGGGSGAGLAIVRRIVERHGGQVWVTGSDGGGTTFWATFPDRDRQ